MTWTADQAERQRLRREWYDKRTATMRERYGVESVYQAPMSLRIKMVVSPWFYDEFGNKTRTITAK